MRLKTFGHACLAVEDYSNKLVLITDPWLIGSCYYDSWFLEHYPSSNDINYLKTTEFIYFTHEHPDHFHPLSIDLFSKATKILIPDFPTKTMKVFLE